MPKPKPYKLRQCPTSSGGMQASLDLRCFEGEGRYIFIDTYHDIDLRPRSARALAKRLLVMADWVEGETDAKD